MEPQGGGSPACVVSAPVFPVVEYGNAVTAVAEAKASLPLSGSRRLGGRLVSGPSDAAGKPRMVALPRAASWSHARSGAGLLPRSALPGEDKAWADVWGAAKARRARAQARARVRFMLSTGRKRPGRDLPPLVSAWQTTV